MSDIGILAGVDKLIDEALHLNAGHYQSKTTCQLLSKGRVPDFDGKTLIQMMLAQIESNWDRKESPSAKNWRWGPKRGELKTKSEEVILERWIVRTMGNDWMNQVPVASGLARSGGAGGRRAIDLVHCCGNGWYEFIELKVNEKSGGTPLFAAMEILQYGVLYIFSRENANKLGYKKAEKDLLRATGIHLKVLAPAAYYEKYDLLWLEKSINAGLDNFLTQPKRGFRMDFKFESLSRSPLYRRSANGD